MRGNQMKEYNSLRDYVRGYVAKKIQSGEIISGDRLSEIELCKELNISRTPTREALLQLASEGLLEYVPRRGFTVNSFSEKEKMDLYAVVALIDAFAARLAVSNISEQNILEMNEYVDKMDVAIKYKNYSNYCEFQEGFHECYRKVCGNNVVLRLLKEFQEGFIPQTYPNQNTEKLFEVSRELNNEHKTIIDLFEKKDEEELFRFLCKHWETRHIDMI